MRDGLGLLLVAAGLTWAVVIQDKLGLVIAFAGVTLLAYGVKPHRSSPADVTYPPIKGLGKVSPFRGRLIEPWR